MSGLGYSNEQHCKKSISFSVIILHKSIAGCYRPVRVADGPITARCRFIMKASWVPPLSRHSHNMTEKLLIVMYNVKTQTINLMSSL